MGSNVCCSEKDADIGSRNIHELNNGQSVLDPSSGDWDYKDEVDGWSKSSLLRATRKQAFTLSHMQTAPLKVMTSGSCALFSIANRFLLMQNAENKYEVHLLEKERQIEHSEMP